MCGICGITSTEGEPIDTAVLARMTAALEHRGPDDGGIEVRGRVGLGFRRLSILDLSPTGHQPMCSRDRSKVIVFNGEIYNFLELRAELEADVPFKGGSDTEVLLAMYDRYGVDMFHRLNGMFAIALFDEGRQTVVLARDRFGKKPLFYWADRGRLAFASELRALRNVPGFPTELDPVALATYFRIGFLPTGISIHPGVRKLPPATYLEWQLGQPLRDPVEYWTLPQPSSDCEQRSVDEWVDLIDATLCDATRIRLRSDVPVGVLLSAGIDSGLVAAAAARTSPTRVRSLTIGFPGFAGDEWPVASQVADALGLEAHHKLVGGDGVQLLEGALTHFDEPFADSSALPMMLVCREAKDHVTVVLSGDGGDELFAGYENHSRAHRLRYIERIPGWLRRVSSRIGVPWTMADSRCRRFFKKLSYPAGTFGVGGKIYPFEDWITEALRPPFRMCDADIATLLSRFVPKPVNSDPLDHAQRTDLRNYLMDDVLVKVDRMSMREAVEVRSPFLDYRVVELALSIPSALRTSRRETKPLTRLIASRYLPHAVVHAPKRGFAIPLRQWLLSSEHTTYFRDLVRDLERPGDVLMPGAATRMWRLAERNAALTTALFRLVAFAMWRRAVLI
jgi:asparagine synthase (glutamine-hydrolysing)